MKTKLFFLSTIFISFSITAQIDFEPHIIIDSHPDVAGPYTINSADIDGDGDKDLLATSTNGDKLVWLENLDGQGNFSAPNVISSTVDFPLAIPAADIDGDGDLDVISASTFDDKISWFENLDGLGNFGPLQFVATLEYAQIVQAEDMDGDGDIDIIAGGDDKVIWLENIDGNGTFAPEKIVSNSIQTTEALEVSDIDGDGDMDVTIADAWSNVVSWYENTDGEGTFGPEQVISNMADLAMTVVTKDMDNDGDLDVISTSFPNYIAWFENTDDIGNFGDPNIIAPNPDLAYKIYAEDLDADGDNDILATIYQSGEIIWLENDGTGNFGSQQIIYTDLVNPIGIIADDFNGDSKMDVAIGGFGTNQIIWFENQGPLRIEENTKSLFAVFPNPTNDTFFIKSGTGISEVAIFNNLSQLLFTFKETNQIDLSTLSQGLYFVKIMDENGIIETTKVVKK